MSRTHNVLPLICATAAHPCSTLLLFPIQTHQLILCSPDAVEAVRLCKRIISQ